MVNARLIYQLEKNRCIPLFQSCLRKGRSTLDNIMSLESKIRNALARRNHLVSIFFDTKKSYHRTWRNGILCTLYGYWLRPSIQASSYVDDLQKSCEGSDMLLKERQLQSVVKGCDTNGHNISARIASQLHGKGAEIQFFWTPSPGGIIGNERAVIEARSVTIPLCVMKRVIQHRIVSAW
ncbi:RNase H domain-containing protein [Trichonephila clavipes]|nr:RNase H domain-containing protein [Trichonephila clavipes]